MTGTSFNSIGVYAFRQWTISLHHCWLLSSLQIVEAIERSLENAQMKTEIASYNRVISEAVGSLSSKTITAATHFPSVRAVQRMVDAVEGLVPLPQQIWRILAAAG
uniref:CAS family C-terminal domain-containing protein n=2 Tax=Lygus hesperus TaxID=30085 RepID=A0A0K8TJ26_LYGHE